MRHFVTGRLLTFAGLLFLLQSAGFPFFPLNGRIDLLYLLILDYAFFYHAERAPYFALTIGLLRDFFGGHLFGIQTASLTASGLLLYLGAKKLDRDDFLIREFMVFVFVILTELLSRTLGSGLEASAAWTGRLVREAVWTSVYTTLCAPAFFWFAERWFKRRSVFKQYELFS